SARSAAMGRWPRPTGDAGTHLNGHLAVETPGQGGPYSTPGLHCAEPLFGSGRGGDLSGSRFRHSQRGHPHGKYRTLLCALRPDGVTQICPDDRVGSDRLGPPCAGHSAVDDWYDPATSERPADVVASDRGRGGHYGRGDGHRVPAGQFRATETRRGSTGCFSRTYYDEVRTPTRVDRDPLDHRVALQLAVGGRDDFPGHLVHSRDSQARRSRRYLARPPDDLLIHRVYHPGAG